MIFLRWLAAALVFTAACTNRFPLPDPEPCDDVSCSEHGDCAVLGDNRPICVCDPGFQAVGLECVAGSPDGDSDGDADGDSDGDADGDSDGDADGDCVGVDEVCSSERPCCPEIDGTCAELPGQAPTCLSFCTMSVCSYGDEAGLCYGAGDLGVCIPQDSREVTAVCAGGAEGCETEYGVTTNTLCVPYSSGTYVCFERCDSPSTECPPGHLCVPSGADPTLGLCVRPP